MSFQALLQVIKEKDRKAGCWPEGVLLLLLLEKKGGSIGAHISESDPFIWAYRGTWLWGTLLSFTGLLGWGKQGLIHSICYSKFRVVLISLAETEMGFCPTSWCHGVPWFCSVLLPPVSLCALRHGSQYCKANFPALSFADVPIKFGSLADCFRAYFLLL